VKRLGPAILAGMFLLLLPSTPRTEAADTATSIYQAMGIAPTKVMNGSILTAKVLPGADKQVVALVTFLTGRRDEAGAVGVRLEVFQRDGDRLETAYARDYGKENGGHVGRGELEIVDLDGDSRSEIVVTYQDARDRVVERRRCEVLVHEGSGFRVAWVGDLEYDATRAARDLPAERRDRYTRKLDVPGTLKTKGVSLIFTKTTIAVAGERLPKPKTTTEAFSLQPGAESRESQGDR